MLFQLASARALAFLVFSSSSYSILSSLCDFRIHRYLLNLAQNASSSSKLLPRKRLLLRVDSANSLSGLHTIITNPLSSLTVESDTMETSLGHCLEHCYSCFALVTICGNELIIFPCIALYSDDKYIISTLYKAASSHPSLKF